MNKLDILAVGAHPDDVEIGAAGALLRAASQGKRTGIVDLTLAEMSSNGTVERRQQEAAAASQLLKLHQRYNFALPDRGLAKVYDEAVTRLVALIRETTPQLVLAPYWQDRHPDHELTSQLVKEAVFNAGLTKWAGKQELPAYRPKQLYYYFINSMATPSFVVDISDIYQEKMNVLRCYRSQFERDEGSVITPLNSGYLEHVEARERILGKEAGVTYAEGFVAVRPLALSSLL